MKPRFSLLPTALLGLCTVLLAGCGGPNLVERITFGSWGLCGIVIIILDIIVLLEVIRSSRTTGDKVLWSLLIVFFPVGGLILYYFFGRK